MIKEDDLEEQKQDNIWVRVVSVTVDSWGPIEYALAGGRRASSTLKHYLSNSVTSTIKHSLLPLTPSKPSGIYMYHLR